MWLRRWSAPWAWAVNRASLSPGSKPVCRVRRPSVPVCCSWTRTTCPPSCRRPSWAFAYRYGAVPYELNLRVEKVLPRISVTELVDAELQTNQVLVNWQGRFQIDDAGLFQLRVTIPAPYEVRTIQGQADWRCRSGRGRFVPSRGRGGRHVDRESLAECVRSGRPVDPTDRAP